MNSEELEVSLRTEFENHLKNVFAEMRQDIAQLQEKIEIELENHKSQLGEVFKQALARAEQEPTVDAGFKDSVVEHLRLARDEGARITATAIAEAEDMQREAAPAVGIRELHEAVTDISTKSSQAEILKTLVQHAGQFTPRGAFFIIKNEHFVGWRTFGSEKGDSDEAVREVFLPFASDSILSESARSLATVESSAGTFSEDASTLNKLAFDGAPEKTYAVPLIVRNRAVAVLYADYGMQGADVNIEALETMVRVAGLTVEVLASSKGTSLSREPRKKISKPFAAEQELKESAAPEYAAVPGYAAPVSENNFKPAFENDGFNQPSYGEETGGEQQYAGFEYKPADAPAEISDYSPETTAESETYAAREEGFSSAQSYDSDEKSSWNDAATETVTEINADDYSTEINADDYSTNLSAESETNDYSQNFSYQPSVEPNVQPDTDFSDRPTAEYQFDDNQSANGNQTSENAPAENYETFAAVPPIDGYAPVAEEKFGSFETVQNSSETSFVAEPVQEVAQPMPPVKSRFSERNVDLPIEVSEDERRLHNDARRFARLLVSEIKLYNEQKVKEGREASDLYDRLREAVDRSREMYDKRVQSPVAAKFDYFHYEVVNTLAEGDENKLGAGYPGASV